MAPRSPFLVTAPDDFWIPGRGALGEATGGALASPDMLVPSAATLGTLTGARRQDGILWGSPWRWPNQGSLFRVHRRDPPAAASPQRPSPRQPREVGGPEGKGQPQSAREADRRHHRVIRGRKEPGGRSRGTRAAEKGGARAEPGQPWVTGAGEPTGALEGRTPRTLCERRRTWAEPWRRETSGYRTGPELRGLD